MDDLISRAAVVRALASSNGDYLDAMERIEKTPAVDAAPVVHGRWVKTDRPSWQYCSECGVTIKVESMHMCKASEDKHFNYCPHCGAKMDKED